MSPDLQYLSILSENLRLRGEKEAARRIEMAVEELERIRKFSEHPYPGWDQQDADGYPSHYTVWVTKPPYHLIHITAPDKDKCYKAARAAYDVLECD